MGCEERGSGKGSSKKNEILSKQRRKMACQRLDQKSAKEVAVKGRSNIGGHDEGDEPRATAMVDIHVYVTVIASNVMTHTDRLNEICSGIDRLEMGYVVCMFQTRDLLSESQMSTTTSCFANDQAEDWRYARRVVEHVEE